jgi:hypothetical protein
VTPHTKEWPEQRETRAYPNPLRRNPLSYYKHYQDRSAILAPHRHQPPQCPPERLPPHQRPSSLHHGIYHRVHISHGSSPRLQTRSGQRLRTPPQMVFPLPPCRGLCHTPRHGFHRFADQAAPTLAIGRLLRLLEKYYGASIQAVPCSPRPIHYAKLYLIMSRTIPDLVPGMYIFFGFSFFFQSTAPETIWRTSSGRAILALPDQHSLTCYDQPH